MQRAFIRVNAFVSVENEAIAGELARKLREAAEQILRGYYAEPISTGADCEPESEVRACSREAWTIATTQALNLSLGPAPRREFPLGRPFSGGDLG